MIVVSEQEPMNPWGRLCQVISVPSLDHAAIGMIKNVITLLSLP